MRPTSKEGEKTTLQQNWICCVALIALSQLSLFMSHSAVAATTGAQGMTVDGRLFSSATGDSPLLDSSVVIDVKIFNPSGSCILYEESQSVDTTSTDGRFTIQVGSPVGSSKRVSGSPTNSMATVFQNYSSIAGSSCSYAPLAGDSRLMRITIAPSTTGTIEILSPDTTIDSVPNALVAETLQGLDRDHVLAIDSTTTLSQANVANIFSATNYPILNGILAGNYVAANSSGAEIPTLGAAPSTHAVGQIWYNSSANAYQYWNGTAVQQLGISGSGISSVTFGSSFTVNGSGPGGTLSSAGGIDLINSGVTPGSYPKLQVNSKGLVIAGSGLVEGDIPNLTTPGHVLGDAITSGTIGGTTAIYSSGNITSTGTVTGGTVSSGVNTTRQIQLFDPAAGSTKAISLSAPTLANNYSVVFPAVQGALGTTLVNDGSGNLSWATAGSGGGGSQWTTSGSSIYYASGNVGIGTTVLTSSLLTLGVGGFADNVPNTMQFGMSGYAPPTGDGSLSNGDKIVMWNDSGAHHIKNSIGNDAFGVWVQASGDAASHFTVWTGPTATAAPLERLRVDSAGNVGIGTSSPAATLQVDGLLRVTGTGSANLNGVPPNLANTSALAIGWNLSAGYGETDFITNAGVGSPGGYRFDIYSNAGVDTNLMSIAGNGNVGIGTTLGGALLDVAGTGVNSAIIVPRATIAQRPTSPVNGMIRYQIDGQQLEAYTNGVWSALATASAGASQWQNGASSIYYSSGAVGVGTNAPAGNFQVYGYNTVANITAQNPGGTTALSLSNGNTAQIGLSSVNSGAGGANSIVMSRLGGSGSTPTGATLGEFDFQSAKSNYSTVTTASILAVNGGVSTDTSLPTYLAFQTTPAGSITPVERVRIDSTGYVGIGSTSPIKPLDVVSPANGYPAQLGCTSGYCNTQFYAGSVYTQVGADATGGSGGIGTASNHDFIIYTNNLTRMFMTKLGFVGIGTSSPASAALDVYGTGAYSALVVPRDLTANRPSGVNGMIRYNTSNNQMEMYANGGWANVAASSGSSAVTSSQWATNGSNIYYSSGAVGIGTATPPSPLEVYNVGTQTGSTFPNMVESYLSMAHTSTSATNYRAIQGTLSYDSASNSTGTSMAVSGYLTHNTAATVTQLVAVNGQVSNQSTGTITNAYGLQGLVSNSTGTITNGAAGYFQLNNSSTGSITNGYGILVGAPFVSAGSIATNYSLYIKKPTAGAVNYALYSEGATNYFGGAVGVGTTTPAGILDLYSVSTANSALVVPRATIAQRPSAPVNGMIRYQTDGQKFEAYANGGWSTLATSAAGATQWATSGSNIYYGTGNVGIGTSNPTTPLSVYNSATSFINADPANGQLTIRDDVANSVGPILYLANYGGFGKGYINFQTCSGCTNPTAQWAGVDDNNFSANQIFYGNAGGSIAGALQPRLFIGGSQASVGVMTTSPKSVFDVLGSASFGSYGGVTAAPTNSVIVGGSVGIGTTTPAALLDVAGSGTNSAIIVPRATIAQRPSAPVNGMIRYQIDGQQLETYTNGVWSAIATGASGASQWTTSSGNIYYSSGNVGIGTTSPGASLHITNASNAGINLEKTGGSAGVFNMYNDGDFHIESATHKLWLNANANGSVYLVAGGGSVSINQTGVTDLLGIQTYDGQGMTMASAGTTYANLKRVGVGATLDLSASNVSTLHLDSRSGNASYINSGSVGIGTTTPAATLDVAGTASVGSSIEGTAAYVSSTTAYSIPDSTLNIRRISLTGNTTITLPAFTTPALKVWTLTVFVKQDSTGGRTLSWSVPSGDSILWDSSATAPTPQTNANGVTIFTFTKASDDTTWYGSMVWKQN